MKQLFGSNGINAITLYWVIGLSGLGGIAYHLWRGDVVSLRRFFGAILLSSLAGCLTFLWLWTDVPGTPFAGDDLHPQKIVAISVLSGIGATTIFDLLIAVLYLKGPQWARIAIEKGWK